MTVNPDIPFQAMRQVDILPLDNALADAMVGLGDCTRVGSYTVDVHTGVVTPIEEGTFAPRVYNLYEFTIDRYNERQHLIDPTFVNKLGFSSIRFLLRDVAHSNINDNIKFTKRNLLDDLLMTVDASDYDILVNIIGLDTPWAMYTGKQLQPGPVDVTSNTITVDTVDTPNILDQNINYDAWPVQQSRDVNSNDEYYPQDSQTIDGKIVRKQVGISGYDIDLDIYCLRTLTVSPTSWPYNFSIADFNNAYSTNYVGVRNLTINIDNYRPKITINSFKYVSTTLNTSSILTTWSHIDNAGNITLNSRNVLIAFHQDSSSYLIKFLKNNGSSNRIVSLLADTYYKTVSYSTSSSNNNLTLNDKWSRLCCMIDDLTAGTTTIGAELKLYKACYDFNLDS